MKRILILVAFLATVLPAGAQLTLGECHRMAREHYPEIRQYDLIRQTTEYTLSNARRAYLPQVSLSAQATWQNRTPGFSGPIQELFEKQGVALGGIHKDQYKATLELNQTLWDGGKLGADRRITQAQQTEQQRSVDVDLYGVEGRVDDLYFGILLLDEQQRQIELTLILLQSNLDKMRSLLQNGVATQSDVDAVEVERLALGQQLAQVTTTRDSYRLMLGVFIGRELGDDGLLRPDVETPQTTDPDRPEQALFDARNESLEAQQAMVRASTNPRFGLFAQGYYGYPGFNFMADMIQGSWSVNFMAGARMQWNFGAYYTRRNSLQSLRTAQKQVEVQRDIFLFNNRLQSVQQNGEIERLHKTLADDRRIVSLRRSVRQAAESKLRNGVIDTNDLLNNITQEHQASLASSAHEIELLKAICELKHTLNR